jgi:hypothetical protein
MSFFGTHSESLITVAVTISLSLYTGGRKKGRKKKVEMSVTKKKTLTSYDLSLACITAVDTMLRSIYNKKKAVDLWVAESAECRAARSLRIWLMIPYPVVSS